MKARNIGKLSATLLTTMLLVAVTTVTAMAADDISYLNPTVDGDGTVTFANATADSVTEITSESTALGGGDSGAYWYMVSDTDGVTIADRITVTGDVHLILADNATLTASSGITVEEGDSLIIYAQSADENTTGKLVATATSISSGRIGTDAGIGGTAYNNAGTITINGGIIEATGGNTTDWFSGTGAGIGGGGSYSGTAGSGGIITINGGIVIATGGSSASGTYIASGAGIGGGASCDGSAGSGEEITINGGSIEATGGAATGSLSASGAGIGGGGTYSGTAGDSGAVNISGTASTITASGGEGTWTGAGIGSGRKFNDTITASGTVTLNTALGYATSSIPLGDILAMFRADEGLISDFPRNNTQKYRNM